MTDEIQQFVDNLRSENSKWVLDVKDALGEVTVTTQSEFIVAVSEFFRDQCKFDMLADLCGCDRGPEEDPRFEVNYHLFSTKHYKRLRLKVFVPEDNPVIPTVTSVWKTANWHERETYDLLGIEFDGHPDLRRILLPSDFDGHALRKDFPLRGYEPYSMN